MIGIIAVSAVAIGIWAFAIVRDASKYYVKPMRISHNVRIVFEKFTVMMDGLKRGSGPEVFQMVHDEITALYKRLDVEEQGAYHELVARHFGA